MLDWLTTMACTYNFLFLTKNVRRFRVKTLQNGYCKIVHGILIKLNRIDISVHKNSFAYVTLTLSDYAESTSILGFSLLVNFRTPSSFFSCANKFYNFTHYQCIVAFFTYWQLLNISLSLNSITASLIHNLFY